MLRRTLEQYFEFEKLTTNWHMEVLAGLTTFVSMAYVIFVKPAILAEAGMPFTGVLIATCLAACFGSILISVLAQYLIATAPGMGLNAYFRCSVVKGLGVPWQTALGAVFLSGIGFLLLNVQGIRRMIIAAIPTGLYAVVACGIGLFIALIGFRNSGIIVASPDTAATLGNLGNQQTILSLAGLLLTSGLLARSLRAAVLVGVLTTTAAAVVLGFVAYKPLQFLVAGLGGTALRLDIRSALGLGALEIVFVFLFVDLFDNVGTLLAVGKRAGLFKSGTGAARALVTAANDDGTSAPQSVVRRLLNNAEDIPRLNRIFCNDALATIAGSLAGTSTVGSYVESAAGVAIAGRFSVTAIVTDLLFLVSIAVAAVVGSIPARATAPALIIEGALMTAHVAEIDWCDAIIAIPSLLTLMAIPLTYSIANGLSFGFVSDTLLRIISGNWRYLHWFTYVLTALLLIRFWYLGAS